MHCSTVGWTEVVGSTPLPVVNLILHPFPVQVRFDVRLILPRMLSDERCFRFG